MGIFKEWKIFKYFLLVKSKYLKEYNKKNFQFITISKINKNQE